MLAEACLSHFEPDVHGTEEGWRGQLAATAVRVQWDPERDLNHHPLPWRSIQIGLGGDPVWAAGGRVLGGSDAGPGSPSAGADHQQVGDAQRTRERVKVAVCEFLQNIDPIGDRSTSPRLTA